MFAPGGAGRGGGCHDRMGWQPSSGPHSPCGPCRSSSLHDRNSSRVVCVAREVSVCGPEAASRVPARIVRITALSAEFEPKSSPAVVAIVGFERCPQDRTTWMAGAYPGISRDCHATVVPGAFSKQKCRALIPTGVRDTLPKCQASFASVGQRGGCRQPGSFRPGNSCCGGARAKGLKTGVAASARRARRPLYLYKHPAPSRLRRGAPSRWRPVWCERF